MFIGDCKMSFSKAKPARLFRCAGDIVYDESQPLPGQICDVQLKEFSETSNFLQCTDPLTPKFPYFFGQIRSLASNSVVTVGIAGPDIDESAHPGKWNASVGYENVYGRCYSHHCHVANTEGEPYSIGDTFGVMVTHFGKQASTVVFIKNGSPVATRYLFEKDHSKFLPMITLENGPIDIGLMWPKAVIGVPKFNDGNLLHWMSSQDVNIDRLRKVHEFHPKGIFSASAIQGPTPLDTVKNHYSIEVLEVGPTGEGPAIGLATCSPLKLTYTSSMLKDFFRWKADGQINQCKLNQVLGIGVCYNPEEVKKPDFCDKDQQIVLLFVTFYNEVILCRTMIQPEGGFFPLVVLGKNCSKIKINAESGRKFSCQELNDLFPKYYEKAVQDLASDALIRALNISMFRKSDALDIRLLDDTGPEKQPSISSEHMIIRCPAEKKGINFIQFKTPFSETHNRILVELVKFNEDSVVAVGLASSDFSGNKHPGNEKLSLGYRSREGHVYLNGKPVGSMEGEPFYQGDTVQLFLHNQKKKWPVALFQRNDKFIATNFYPLYEEKDYLPTIGLSGNGFEIEIHVYWQKRLSGKEEPGEVYSIEGWCLPNGCQVQPDENIVTVPEHADNVLLQWPRPLCPSMNLDYFEISVIDDLPNDCMPPGIALTTAGEMESVNMERSSSTFDQDFIRFFAVGEARSLVSKGTKIGWGIIYPKSQEDKEKKLVVCYLCINRNVHVTSVLYEPPGGFFPTIFLPQEVNRVKVEHIVHIHTHPITEEIQEGLLWEAEEQIKKEKEMLEKGIDPRVEKENLFHTLHEAKKICSQPKKLKTVAQVPIIVNKMKPKDKSNNASVNSGNSTSGNNTNVAKVKSSTCNVL